VPKTTIATHGTRIACAAHSRHAERRLVRRAEIRVALRACSENKLEISLQSGLNSLQKVHATSELDRDRFRRGLPGITEQHSPIHIHRGLHLRRLPQRLLPRRSRRGASRRTRRSRTCGAAALLAPRGHNGQKGQQPGNPRTGDEMFRGALHRSPHRREDLMPTQHTPLRKHKIDKFSPSFGGAFFARKSWTSAAFARRKSRLQQFPLHHPYAPFAQNRENFTLRYLLGSFRNSFRSRRRSPATPLILS